MDAIQYSDDYRIETEEQAARAVRDISGDLAVLEDCLRCITMMPLGEDTALMTLSRVLSLTEVATELLSREANLLSIVADFYD